MIKKSIYALECKLRKMVKRSALGGQGNDTTLEETIANLAHLYLQDKAPSLVPYEQGFQVVERNEDDTKVLGITGFKIHGMQLFSPVFMINGEIKGHELLRLADQNLWVPLKEAWLNEVFRRKPITIGSSTEKKQNGLASPDLSGLSDLPEKYASWHIRPFLYAPCRNMAQSIKTPISKVAASLRNALNPMNYVKSASVKGLEHVYSMLAEYPLIKRAFQQLHPDGFEQIQREVQFRRSLRKSAHLLPLVAPRCKYANSVRVISYEVNVSPGLLPLGLCEQEKEQLLRTGYSVQDSRRDEEVSRIVHDNDQLDTLFSPSVSGLYDVMVKPGTVKRMAVLRDDYHKHSDAVRWYVVDPNTSDSSNAMPSKNIHCVKSYPIQDFLKWVDKQSQADPQPGTSVLLVRGSSEVAYEYLYGDVTRTPAGSAYKREGNTCCIPEDMKILEVNLKDNLLEKFNSLDFLTQPATVRKIKEACYRGTEPVKILVRSGECCINNSRPMPAFEGFKSLIVDYGLREKDAKALMKQAESHPQRILKTRIKRAALETPSFPSIPDSPSGLLTSLIPPSPSGTRVSTSYSSDAPKDPQMNVDNDYASQDVAAVQQAIQSGQKDIFDLSMIRSLYVDGDTDSEIDQHVTALTRAMTEAGDLLFRFYWKGDQFKEIYGPKNLPELEGNLKKMFEILGDVVLFLKRNRLNQADYEQLEPLNLADNSK